MRKTNVNLFLSLIVPVSNKPNIELTHFALHTLSKFYLDSVDFSSEIIQLDSDFL